MSNPTTTVPRIFSALRAFHAQKFRIRVGRIQGDLFGIIEDGVNHTPTSMIVKLAALLNSQRLGWETYKRDAGDTLLSFRRELQEEDSDQIVLRDRIEVVKSCQSERELVAWLDHWGRARCYNESAKSVAMVSRELDLWKHAEDVFVARFESYDERGVDHDTAVDLACDDCLDKRHNEYAWG